MMTFLTLPEALEYLVSSLIPRRRCYILNIAGPREIARNEAATLQIVAEHLVTGNGRLGITLAIPIDTSSKECTPQFTKPIEELGELLPETFDDYVEDSIRHLVFKLDTEVVLAEQLVRCILKKCFGYRNLVAFQHFVWDEGRVNGNADDPADVCENAVDNSSVEPIAHRDSSLAVPMSAQRERVPIDLRFGAEEFAVLARGKIPRVMESRWFVFHENGWVYFHRSWTGHCIYQVRFAVEDGDYVAQEAWVTRDRSQYRGKSPEHESKGIQAVINMTFSIGTYPKD